MVSLWWCGRWWRHFDSGLLWRCSDGQHSNELMGRHSNSGVDFFFGVPKVDCLGGIRIVDCWDSEAWDFQWIFVGTFRWLIVWAAFLIFLGVLGGLPMVVAF